MFGVGVLRSKISYLRLVLEKLTFQRRDKDQNCLDRETQIHA